MSHPLVAAVWEQLGRRDVGNILREIIGEHAAELAVFQGRDDVSRVEPLTRPVFWIRAIFDLQRTYLQGLTSVHDCHPSFLPYLLSSEAIFSTSMYLIRVKSDLFPCTTSTAPELVRHRHFIAQTLLAGVRLLMMHGENIRTEMKFNLERAMRAAWQHHDLSNAEAYLINELLPKAIDSIGSPDLSKIQGSVLVVNNTFLPSLASGLYPISITPETLITDLLTALVGNKADQLTPFCVLFDIISAAEFALIQCHVDRRRVSHEQGISSPASFQVEEASGQAQETRKKLVRTVLAAFDDEFNTPPLQILATIILSQNVEDQPPLQTRRIRDTWTQLSCIRNVLEGSLGHLVRWLINRRVQMWDCNGELEAFSQDYQQHLTQWLQNSSYLEGGQEIQRRERPASILYAVNCPTMHMVSKSQLEDRLKERDSKVYEQLRENPEFLKMDISCPMCPGNKRIQHARMIQPFENLSNTLDTISKLELNRRNSTQGSVSASWSGSLSHSTSCSSARIESGEIPKSPVSPISRTLGLSETIKQPAITVPELFSPLLTYATKDQTNEKQLIRSLSKEFKSVRLSFSGGGSLFRRNSSKEHRLPRQPRFCFSATGKSLLVWGADSSWVIRFEIPTIEGQKPRAHRYDVSGVHYAAAGNQRCAVIASVGEHFELFIFERTGIIAEASLAIETEMQSRSIPYICMVMSRDDRYVAFTMKDQVRVYEISGKTIQKVSLGDQLDQYLIPNKAHTAGSRAGTPLGIKEFTQNEERQEVVIERKVQFSVDGKHLIVATHLGDHCAYVDVWDFKFGRWDIGSNSSRSFKLPPWTDSDGGLTCVFYDSIHCTIMVTAFLGKEYPLFFSLVDQSIASDPLSTRIVHAAQSPLGSRFAVANGMSEIYVCDPKARGALSSSRLKKASSKISSSTFKPGHLALAFPQEDELLAFWIRDGKPVLRMIELRDGSEAIHDYDLRSDFDRLLVERPPINNFQAPVRRHSLLSKQSIAEMEPITSIPRPHLPELSAG